MAGKRDIGRNLRDVKSRAGVFVISGRTQRRIGASSIAIVNRDPFIYDSNTLWTYL